MLKLQASGCLQCSVAMKPLLIDVYATLKLEMDCKTKRESNVKPVKREESNQNIRVETYVYVCAVHVRRSRWWVSESGIKFRHKSAEQYEHYTMQSEVRNTASPLNKQVTNRATVRLLKNNGNRQHLVSSRATHERISSRFQLAWNFPIDWKQYYKHISYKYVANLYFSVALW